MFKTILTAFIITLLNLFIFAIGYSIPSTFGAFVLTIANLTIMIYYLSLGKIESFSIRLFFYVVFQMINSISFFKYNCLTAIFNLINPNYGKPSAGTGFSILILLPTYILCISVSILISSVVHIVKKNKDNASP